MDPILEEMQRAKSPADIKESRYRDWVTYLCALVARKDDEIATLKSQLTAITPEEIERGSQGAVDVTAVKRGPGRPRKEDAHVS